MSISNACEQEQMFPAAFNSRTLPQADPDAVTAASETVEYVKEVLASMKENSLKYQRLVTAERNLIAIAQPCIEPSSYAAIHSQTNPYQLLLICTERIFELPALLFDLSKFSQEYFTIGDPEHLYTSFNLIGSKIIEQKVLFVFKALYLFVLCQEEMYGSLTLTIYVV